jgi:peptidoglycan/LPS O-acetylase OafA/YrhL
MNTANPKKSSRILELDALRALSAISLMLFHFTHVYSVKYGYTSDLGFEYSYGKYGVQLFFMLSGYVNAMTLLSKRQPLDFLASRSIRILPSYLIVLGLNLVLLTMMPFAAHGVYSWDQVLANLTMMPNLFGYECLEPVMWTLQVEILFYGILLAMFVSGAMDRPVRPLMLYMVLSVAGTWYLDGLASGAGTTLVTFTESVEQLLLLPYMPLFAMGMLIHQIRTGNGRLWQNLGGIIVATVVFHLIDKRDHNPAATILMLGLLAGSAYGRIPLLRTRPLVFVSAISYSLYLLHNNLGTAFIYYVNHAGLPPVTCFVLVFLFVIVVSALATFYLERPISKAMRTVWIASRTRLPAAWIASQPILSAQSTPQSGNR